MYLPFLVAYMLEHNLLYISLRDLLGLFLTIMIIYR